jgi:hypothetical protein
MIVSAPNNFSDMVTMGTRLEEAVREGIIMATTRGKNPK